MTRVLIAGYQHETNTFAPSLADWAARPDGAADRVGDTLRRAMTAAAINCTRAGCQPPTAAELETALA